MDLLIKPAKLRGTVRAIPSKSEAHRALILAALAAGRTVIRPLDTKECIDNAVGAGGFILSDDISYTVDALCSLGAGIDVSGDEITVTSPVKYAGEAVIDCGESGSTLRFLIPVCAALGGSYRFIRRKRLPQRPISALIGALAPHGVEFAEDGDDLLLRGRLSPGDFIITCAESSQYVTGLLMALPLIGGKVRVVGELESAPYVDITLKMLQSFGADVQVTRRGEETEYALDPCVLRAKEITVGGDWSGAANFIAAGVDVVGLDETSAQGDRAILDIISAMTADTGNLRSADVDMRQTPDIVPLVAVLCAAAEGTSVIRGVRRLRLKESDRVESTLALLSSLGCRAYADENVLTVVGGGICGGEVDSFGDHRIAMAAAAAASFSSENIVLRRAECVAKSYPLFWEAFRALGGDITEI